MYTITQSTSYSLPDVAAFLDMLNRLNQHSIPEIRDLFDPVADLIVSRAPGRLDVMGGIADYSGSLVLQLPTQEATFAALQRCAEPSIRIISLGAEENDRSLVFEMPMSDFMSDGKLLDYEVAQTYFQRNANQHWAAYAAGVFLVLMRERDIRFVDGVRVLISSDVPEGKGVSSSAALEVAVMQAVAAAYDIQIAPREMALLCQMVENLVVGAPCGVMDQMSSVCGEADQLLSLLCQPAELQPPVALPDEVAVWGLDSGVRHAVSGADYGSVRVGAFMGYRILADLAGLLVKSSADNQPMQITDPYWSGHLANLSPGIFEKSYAAQIPETLSGHDFLLQYGNTTDAVTQVDPNLTYAVRVPTAHPVYEHFRVHTFAALLVGQINNQTLRLLGELMYQSHASYSACGLGEPQTDRLVQMVRDVGPEQGLFGAKITGGGSGGTVAVLGRRGADAAIQAIADRYAAESGHQPYIFSGSSPGATEFGHIWLEKA